MTFSEALTEFLAARDAYQVVAQYGEGPEDILFDEMEAKAAQLDAVLEQTALRMGRQR